MKHIGTFLITTVFAAGLIFGGTKPVQSMAAEFSTNTDAEVTIIPVDESEKSKTTDYYATPKLLVTGRDIKGNAVNAGDEFDMVIHFKNESNSTKLRNISIKLSSEENKIVTASGSDSFYVSKLDKEEECEVKVRMKAKGDLAQGNYTVSVNYTYEDNSKNTFEDSASLVIPVVQESKISISEKKLSKSEVKTDGKTSLSLKVNNMGLDKLRNVTVDVESDTIQDINYFVGTIEPGENGSVDVTITPEKVGNSDIKIKVTYEDTLGNTLEYEDSIGLTVTEAKAETEETPAKAASINPVLITIIAAVVLIAVVAGIIKKKKQKNYE